MSSGRHHIRTHEVLRSEQKAWSAFIYIALRTHSSESRCEECKQSFEYIYQIKNCRPMKERTFNDWQLKKDRRPT